MSEETTRLAPASETSARNFGRSSLDQVLAAVPPGWSLFRDAVLPGHDGGPPARLGHVLAHPEIGIAVLELLPGPTSDDPVGRLHRVMEESGWPNRPGGLPPVVRLCMPFRTLPQLAALLDEAFAGQPPAASQPRGWIAALPGLLGATPLPVAGSDPAGGVTTRAGGFPASARARTPEHRPSRRSGLRILAWFWGGVALVSVTGITVLAYLGPPGESAESAMREDAAGDGQPVPSRPALPSDLARAPLLLPPLPAPERQAIPRPDERPGTFGMVAVPRPDTGREQPSEPLPPAPAGTGLPSGPIPTTAPEQAMAAAATPDGAAAANDPPAPKAEHAAGEGAGPGSSPALPADIPHPGLVPAPPAGHDVTAEARAMAGGGAETAGAPAAGSGVPAASVGPPPIALPRPGEAGTSPERVPAAAEPAPLLLPAGTVPGFASSPPSPPAPAPPPPVALDRVVPPAPPPTMPAASHLTERAPEDGAPLPGPPSPKAPEHGDSQGPAQALPDLPAPPRPDQDLPARVAASASSTVGVPDVATPPPPAEPPSPVVLDRPVPGGAPAGTSSDDMAGSRPATIRDQAPPIAGPGETGTEPVAPPPAAQAEIGPATVGTMPRAAEGLRPQAEEPPAPAGPPSTPSGAGTPPSPPPPERMQRAAVAQPGNAAPPAAAARPAGAGTTAPAPRDPILRRADAMLALGDVSAARLLYARAAAAGHAEAMLALGKLHDPLFLAEIGARGLSGDAGAAVDWYRRALALGLPEARTWLLRHGVQPEE
ncbi:hypothetical protein [Paracraurococcus lichenis]|uniref:Sel1 repeat family protein n=1 Tax=Paracraurococcus lichenis TaxID=3064888 RepID=A0ABT9DZU1_9PROT|nr:hypothetical protein [Paracraurococcus sp. LOR1-02]MDO9709260.1 hypothetical protein [Paracraurococcus sp. LOR1-02]